MTNTEIKTLLITYVELILKCEKLLKEKYEIDGIPYGNRKKLPKKNEVQAKEGLLKYNFHGAGCTFLLNDVELSYDVDLTNKDYLVTSSWKFLQFLNSYLKPEENLKEEQIRSYFLSLEEERILIRILPGYWTFQINFDWVFSKTLPT